MKQTKKLEGYWSPSRINNVWGADIRDFDENFPLGEHDYLFDHVYIKHLLWNLQGKVLTIVEGCLPDGTQQKAVKDLIRAQFSNKISIVETEAYTNDTLSFREEMFAEAADEVTS